MLKLSVNYFAKPGRREEFLRRIVEGGILAAIRAEEGCLRYDYYLSPARTRTKFSCWRSGTPPSTSAYTWSRSI